MKDNWLAKILFLFSIIVVAMMLLTIKCSGQSVCDKWQVCGNYGTTNSSLLGTKDTFSLKFGINSLEKMRLTNSGYLGLGTPSPSYKLDVNGTSNFGGVANFGGTVIHTIAGQNFFANSSNITYLYTPTGGFQFTNQANTTPLGHLTNVGNFDVIGNLTSSATTGINQFNSTLQVGQSGADRSILFGGTNAGLYWGSLSTPSNALYYSIGNLVVSGGSGGYGLIVNNTLTAGTLYSTSGGVKFPDNSIQTTANNNTGTVTSVATGYGLTGGTITSTGTLKADTTHLPTANGLATQYDLASYLKKANNLSDLASASTARTNLGLGTIATQNSNSVTITGGTINGTTIGASTPSTGAFSTISGNSTTSTTPTLSFNAANAIGSFGSTTASSYNQFIVQNKSTSNGASANYVVSNDLGTDNTYYAEMGMNSSIYSSGTPADFFSINNGTYFSAHDGDITFGSGNGKKSYFAWGSSGQSAHVINSSGAIGLNTDITGTTNYGTAGQYLTSQGSAASPTWTSGISLSANNVFTTYQTIQNNGIANTSTDGLIVSNTTAATNGVQIQRSPRLHFGGKIWDGSASQSSDFFVDLQPTTAGGSNVKQDFVFSYPNASAVVTNLAAFHSETNSQASNLATFYSPLYITGNASNLQSGIDQLRIVYSGQAFGNNGSLTFYDNLTATPTSYLAASKLTSWAVNDANGQGALSIKCGTSNTDFMLLSTGGTGTSYAGATGSSTKYIQNFQWTYFGSASTVPTSTMQVAGSVAYAYRAITAIRTLDATDYLVDCTANSFTVTLPTAVGIQGRCYIIKNTGTATTISVATTSSQTIDGSASGTVTGLTPLRVMSTGANWITW